MVSNKDDNGPACLPFVNEDETVEKAGPFFFIQKKKGHKLTEDSVLLCEFLPPVSGCSKIIDLGTGSGIIPLLLASKTGARITGVEIENAMAELAQRNVEANGLCAQVSIINMDIRELPGSFEEGSFDVVVANPPYVKAGAGRTSPVKERASARIERHGALKDFLKVSAYLIGAKGKACYVFPSARLFEMLKELRGSGLFPNRLRFIHTDPLKKARLFLVEAGRREGLKIEEPLFI